MLDVERATRVVAMVMTRVRIVFAFLDSAIPAVEICKDATPQRRPQCSHPRVRTVASGRNPGALQ
jgi:hypothetical protein